MKGLIIYKSKYGAARQYAHWIGNDLNFPVADVKNVTDDRLKQAGIVIVGSSIYAGKAIIRRWLRVHQHQLKGKLLFIFLVAGTPSGKTIQLERYKVASIPAELRSNTHTFFLPGKLTYNKLSWFDKLVLKAGAFLMKKDGQRNIMMDYDDVKRENVDELVASIKKVIADQSLPLQEPHGSYPV